MNNFAICTSFNLDTIDKRIEEYNKINLTPEASIYITNEAMKEYTYDMAGKYFQNLKEEICEFIGIESNTFTMLDARNNLERGNFGFIHNDIRRLCCLSIPIYKITHPIHFHKSKTDRESIQTVEYSNFHPNLVNVNHFHRIDYHGQFDKKFDEEFRIMFQINFSVTFEEIVSRRPEIWTVASRQGYQKICL